MQAAGKWQRKDIKYQAMAENDQNFFKKSQKRVQSSKNGQSGKIGQDLKKIAPNGQNLSKSPPKQLQRA